jgi:hypothetical protein
MHPGGSGPALGQSLPLLTGAHTHFSACLAEHYESPSVFEKEKIWLSGVAPIHFLVWNSLLLLMFINTSLLSVRAKTVSRLW